MNITQEVFAVGIWNGMPFGKPDLEKMADSFNKLKSILKVPLKLGHNDEQPVTDGQPALGWVTQLSVIGDKLVAEFEDVPEIVFNAFTKKLYRSVSIELDFDVTHKGTNYDFVLTAVALLGADMPAVNVLNDLAKYMSRNSELIRGEYTAGYHTTFIFKTGNIEETIMTPEQIAKLQADHAAIIAEAATLKANFAALQASADADKLARDTAEATRLKAEQDTIISTARNKFATILETAVTEKRISPAQREVFAKVLRLDDDDAVIKLVEADVKALFGNDDANKFSKESGKQEGDNTDEDVGVTLTTKTYDLMTKTGEKDFSRALTLVMKADPVAARDYIDSNGEIQ